MRSFILSCLLLLAVVPMLSGKIIEKEQARQVAKNFLTERILSHQLAGTSGALYVTDVASREVNGQPAMYVFSNNGQGFIIISAEDAITPVLGYSPSGSFPEKGISQNFDSYLNTYLSQVEWVRNQTLFSDAEVAAEWSHYSNYTPEKSATATTDVQPMLTCLWNQDGPYNVLCPADPAGPGGHVYAGCVATAMSMIMYYYRYPLVGIGTHSYYASGYGTLSVNYGATHYDWDGMLDQVNNSSGQSIPAVAQLQYHAGVAVNMQYAATASGAYSTDVPTALISHFGYSSTTQYLGRSSYTASQWESMMLEQLDASKPVYYSGTDPTPVTGGGHAFVCDGYQVTGSTKMYHFNFGWSGSGNGYFTLANPNGFTTSQGMVRNIIPGTNYPYGCNNTLITDANGSFEDRSSPRQNYSSNLSCTWLIDPSDSISTLSLAFTVFNVDNSDTVYVYNGTSDSAPLLGKYTGNAPPATINSTGGQLFLKFVTDGSNESTGWMAEYHSVYPAYCSGTTTMTEPYGSFSDGSGDNNYNNNSICKWKIQPPYATGLTLTFNSFDLEVNDELMIYATGTSSTLLGTFTGNQIPGPIVSPTGALLLMFKANGYNTAQGFDAFYTTSNVGTDKLAGVSGLSLSPNPASAYSILRLINSEALNLQLSISDMAGKQLYSENVQGSTGGLEKTISLSNFLPGMYLFSLKTEKGTISRKLIVK